MTKRQGSHAAVFENTKIQDLGALNQGCIFFTRCDILSDEVTPGNTGVRIACENRPCLGLPQRCDMQKLTERNGASQTMLGASNENRSLQSASQTPFLGAPNERRSRRRAGTSQRAAGRAGPLVETWRRCSSWPRLFCARLTGPRKPRARPSGSELLHLQPFLSFPSPPFPFLSLRMAVFLRSLKGQQTGVSKPVITLLGNTQSVIEVPLGTVFLPTYLRHPRF